MAAIVFCFSSQSHIGESAVLIHSETATGASDDTLDISQLMSTTSEGAMAVEIRSCIFRVRQM